jgi:hypothetical protein
MENNSIESVEVLPPVFERDINTLDKPWALASVALEAVRATETA